MVVCGLVHGGVQLYSSVHSGVELREYGMEEKDVLRTLNAVSATKKQVERVRLDVCACARVWCFFHFRFVLSFSIFSPVSYGQWFW